MGRIYRVVHNNFKPDTTTPRMLEQTSGELVKYLGHPNGWWRDMAQQLLIIRNDTSVISLLKTTASENKNPLARIHALWTLEGMNAVTKEILYKAFADKDGQLRKTAVWISEQFIRKNDSGLIGKLAELKNDSSADVRVQLSLSLRSSKNPEAKKIVKELLAENPGNEMMQFSWTTFVEADKHREAERRRTLDLSPAERKLVKDGQVIFNQLCVTCHGANGKGIMIAGKEMPAPILAGSPRVKGDKIMLTQLLLNGLKGPVDGKTYPDIMPSMWAQNDEWIASVLSYIRNSGDVGNNSSVVTPEEVKETRSKLPKIPGGMTLQQLEIFKLGRAERTNWNEPTKKGNKSSADSTKKKS